MHDSRNRTDSRPRRRAPRAIGLLIGALSIVGLVACAQVPQAVVSVPSTYTFGTAPDAPSPGGSVIVCHPEATSLYIRASLLAYGVLDWTPFGGTTRQVWGLQDTSGTKDGFTQTVVLEPGCGVLSIRAYFENGPYTGPPTITVEVTDVPPPACIPDCFAT